MSDKSIILYTPTCSNCKNRTQANLARNFARSNQLGFIMRRTDYALDFANEAKHRSKLLPPLLYNESTGKSVPFSGNLTEELLKELL